MAWPAEETPTSGGVWLECNGQAIDSKYVRLRELVGDHTPNYQGVFLRGYGSRNESVYTGMWRGNLNFAFHSGRLGEVQTDAIRPFRCSPDPSIIWSDESSITRMLQNPAALVTGGGAFGGNWYFPTYYNNENYTWYNGVYYPEAGAYDLNESNPDTTYSKIGNVWIMTRPPMKVVETDNGSYEEEDTGSGFYQFLWVSAFHLWPEISVPTANENRPINIAVRYFIKAR